MFKVRLIPVLLLKQNILVKTVQFKSPKYLGDPINAVRIFNELKADELIFLDIEASKNKTSISPALVQEIGEEAQMPFAVGGGICQPAQVEKAIMAGAEKVVIGTEAVRRPSFIQEVATTFGSTTVSVCIDYQKNFWGKTRLRNSGGDKKWSQNVIAFAQHMEAMGAGEIILQSVHHDGMRGGMDLEMIKKVSTAVTIPVVALGGAGYLHHMRDAFVQSYASAVAGGSMFVYQGNQKGVLINYPDTQERNILTHEPKL